MKIGIPKQKIIWQRMIEFCQGLKSGRIQTAETTEPGGAVSQSKLSEIEYGFSILRSGLLYTTPSIIYVAIYNYVGAE
jgi:hypothetical protein